MGEGVAVTISRAISDAEADDELIGYGGGECMERRIGGSGGSGWNELFCEMDSAGDSGDYGCFKGRYVNDACFDEGRITARLERRREDDVGDHSEGE